MRINYEDNYDGCFWHITNFNRIAGNRIIIVYLLCIPVIDACPMIALSALHSS